MELIMSVDSKFSFQEITIEEAEANAKPILEKAKQRIGYIPNIYGMMANSAGLLGSYISGDNNFRENALFSSSEKEIIYLTISKENSCRYCVAVHSTLSDTMSKVPRDVTNAIRDGSEVPDIKYEVLVNFTRVMVVSRGRPTTQEINNFLSVGYTEHHILEIILAIAVKTMTNYSNHLFKTPVDKVFQGREWVNT